MPVQSSQRTPAIRAMLLLATGLCALMPACADGSVAEIPAPTVAAPTTPAQKSLLVEMQDAFIHIAQTAEPFVVNIKSDRLIDPARMPKDAIPLQPQAPGGDNGGSGGGSDQSPFPRRAESTGSGEIVSPDGYILTNDHVVEGAKTVTVTLNDGREFVGDVSSDRASDLAVVKIDPGNEKLPYCTFADSDKVESGEWAIAIGSPFDLQNTMTVGVISATRRHQTIGDSPASARYYPDLIQTDAAINPGNSGGPLIDIDGHVMGINVAIESPVEGSAGVGFAIPSRIARYIMNELIKNGKVVRGYLGLAPTDLGPVRSAEYGVTSGAWVIQVDKDSPAGRAGIHAADTIQSFDGKPITDELSLRMAISEAAPGKTVPVNIVRDGAPVTVSVTVASPPPPASDAKADTPSSPQQKIGISIRTLDASDRDQMGLDPTINGAFVTAVLANSPAERAHLVTGDVITRIGKAPIATSDDAAQALTALAPGAESTVIIMRSSGANKIQEIALDLKLWR